MSESEDGLFQSPAGAERSGDEEEHDADSLDIKPPQASVMHQRDSTGSRRKEKNHKEKKHSKERKHKERNNSGHDRSSDMERNSREHHRRDEQRNDIDRYHHHHQRGSSSGGGVYEREDVLNSESRRYQKHFERSSGGNNSYHQHYQQQQQHSYHQHHGQMHMQQRQRQDYYERGYHHGGGSGAAFDYHGANRHQQHQAYVKHGGGGGHVDYELDMHREHRKYSYEQQKDAESLEQDLRSRLLSKRNHYVKGGEGGSSNDMENEQHYSMSRRDNNNERQQHERSYEEHERRERHRVRHDKTTRESVIEVLDSPELGLEAEQGRQKRKHKHRSIKDVDVVETQQAKRKTPDDPDLLQRRAKILAAEREKERRKETAREELQARRERRERTAAEVIDELSPTAVAASVTAGLNVVVKRKKSDAGTAHAKKKRTQKHSDYDEDEKDDDDDEEEETENPSNEDEDDSENASDSSAVESEHDYKKSKSKSKRNVAAVKATYSDVEEVQLPDSPLSIGALSKSPEHSKKQKKKKQKHPKRSNSPSNYAEAEDSDEEEHSSKSYSANSSGSSSQPASRSSHASQRSHSRSHSRSYSPTSRSRSRSRSYSHSTASRSRTRSRSRSRSEERAMRANKGNEDERNDTKETAAATAAEQAKKKLQSEIDAESPVLDDKGVPLPNYFPGVQGCRSVEEFQCLNRIEEGTYGVVYRAKDKRTSEIVALKRLKMEKEKEGFPITSLREINTLLKGQHPNIVTVREIVVGSNMDKIFIVMDYVEHDLKSLMETMKNRKQSFFPGEVKCLIEQLLRAVGHLHDNWILHRDLKTSNLLLSHKGILKVGDFGLAREYGSPLKKYTSLVVTLWYRAPELLLCSPEYSTPIDIWSVGCIFAEFLQMMPLFPGKTELDELNKIFKLLGTPNEKIWPGYKELPAVKNLQNSQFADYPVSSLSKHFSDKTSEAGISLLHGLLTYDPKQRLNADRALNHTYFKELPLPIDPSMFPTWPAKSELGARKALASSPKPPSGGSQFKQLGRDDIITTASGSNSKVVSGIITGNKKTAANTGFVLNAGIDQRQLAMGPGFSLKF